MLLDLLEFARNPYPWHLAPMGYVREARLIARRGRELAPAWREHLENTRTTIEQSIDQCKSHGTVCIVGSGNLLDVPIETLSQAFSKVLLLDIVHMQKTREAARPYANVELVAADVTGVSKAVFDRARRKDVSVLPKSMPPNIGTGPIDLIISVNLLSQLSVIPCNFLTGHSPTIPPSRLSAFGRDLIETHLSWLTQVAGHVCLVTDVLRIEKYSDGAMVTKDIIEGKVLPTPDKTWSWQIAPIGSVFKDFGVTHLVHAHRNFRSFDMPY